MKKLILTLSLLFVTLSVFALDDNISIKFSQHFSIANGSLNEYVFDEACKNTDNKESQLDWDIKMIPLLSMSMDVDIIKYIHLGMNGYVGLPNRSGNMQDYDWLNSVTNGWKDQDPKELTNYSIHDNYLDKYIGFTFMGGGNIYLPLEIKLTPMIGYQYEFIAFGGINGYGTYKGRNWIKEDFSGAVISYKQELNAFLMGLSADINSIPRTYIYADFICSPAMTFINALDYHYVRSLVFWDKFTNIWQLSGSLKAQYTISKYISTGLNASIQYIPLSKGPTSSKYLKADGSPYPGNWTKTEVNGGTQRLLWTVGINYSFSL